MSTDYSKEWLKVNRICKEIKWLIYDPEYKDIDLKKALEIMEELREKIAEELNK